MHGASAYVARPSPLSANESKTNCHEFRLPHRSQAMHVAGIPRYGPSRAARTRAAGRLHPFRLISCPGDRSPRSPRNANALGSASGGVFFCAFAMEFMRVFRVIGSHPQASGHGPPEERDFRCEARKRCARMLGTGGGRMRSRTRIGACTGANAKHLSKGFPAVRARMPVRCARRCRGVCRRPGEGVSRRRWLRGRASVHADYAGSNPARRHWIAQLGRATDS